MDWFFAFFVLSGYCSLVCEIVWIRLSMASFGVNATVMSVMLSIFMAGLGLGSYAAGRLKGRAGVSVTPARFLQWYAVCELLIGVSGLVMGPLFAAGQRLVQAPWFALAWGSFWFHAATGLALVAIVLPWAVCMGATFPLALAALEAVPETHRRTSFSFLYNANLFGAAVGTCCAAFLWIELFGLRGTLWLTAAANVLIAALAWRLSRRMGTMPLALPPDRGNRGLPAAVRVPICPGMARALLVGSGFASLGLELVWVRLYTPHVGTNVYAFAAILVLYLVASALGTSIYRRWLCRGRDPAWELLMTALAGSSALALLATDQRVADILGWLGPGLSLLLGVGPFCCLAGMVTPLVIDRYAQGDAAAAGEAYALNVVGCILGPLVTGFLLLPWLGERMATVSLGLVLFVLVAYSLRPRTRVREAAAAESATGNANRLRLAWLTGLAVFGLICREAHLPYDATQPWIRDHVLKRDYEATTLAITGRDGSKHLRVNGVGMTVLTPITKTMAHLPLALLPQKPERMLVVCFGMGTTFRSALAWGIDVDAVDLVPAVPQLFGYFFADAPRLLASPKARIVVDDGRRFLVRTSQRYDVIAVDPPPPCDSAASGLLYSTGFYRLAKARLLPGGILQQWYPGGDDDAQAGVARALQESFRYVRVFGSLDGWGNHFLASDSPIAERSAEELVRRCPPAAQADFVEWGPNKDAAGQFSAVLEKELPLAKIVAQGPLAVTLTDDRPVNEYYLVRHCLPGLWRRWQRWLSGEPPAAPGSANSVFSASRQ